MYNFSQFFLEKWIFPARKMLKFLKMDSFSNTVNQFPILNLLDLRTKSRTVSLQTNSEYIVNLNKNLGTFEGFSRIP